MGDSSVTIPNMHDDVFFTVLTLSTADEEMIKI